MKIKLILIFILLIVMNMLSAQKYEAYDEGKTSSVLFTYNNDKTKLESVSYSVNQVWQKYEIVDSMTISQAAFVDKGIWLWVKDLDKKMYVIMYSNLFNEIEIRSCNENKIWLNEPAHRYESRASLAAKTEAKLKAKYKAFDGETFNILLTFDTDKNDIESVSYSYNGEWQKFSIVDTTIDKDDLFYGPDSYIIKVRDGNNKLYEVYHTIDSDKLDLYACDEKGYVISDKKWHFTLRKENK